MEDDDNYLFPFHVGFKNGWGFTFTPLMQLKEAILSHSKIPSFSEHALRKLLFSKVSKNLPFSI